MRRTVDTAWRGAEEKGKGFPWRGYLKPEKKGKGLEYKFHALKDRKEVIKC